jgi:hypothetical protein
MISYFWQGAVFFFLLECGGRTRTVNAGESLTWRAGAAFLTAARASHHPSDVGGDPARCCDRGSVCVRWGHPINENTLSAASEREGQKFNQPPRSAREIARTRRPPRTSRSLDQRRRGRGAGAPHRRRISRFRVKTRRSKFYGRTKSTFYTSLVSLSLPESPTFHDY